METHWTFKKAAIEPGARRRFVCLLMLFALIYRLDFAHILPLDVRERQKAFCALDKQLKQLQSAHTKMVVFLSNLNIALHLLGVDVAAQLLRLISREQKAANGEQKHVRILQAIVSQLLQFLMTRVANLRGADCTPFVRRFFAFMQTARAQFARRRRSKRTALLGARLAERMCGSQL